VHLKSFRNMQKKIILFLIVLMFFGLGTLQAVKKQYIHGYEVPKICLTSNIRCILKKQGSIKYWCLKSSFQRTLDAARNTSPIKKTYRENTGQCAKKIAIHE